MISKKLMLFILVLMMAVGASGFAMKNTGTVEVWHAHNNQSVIYIRGETAKLIYERIQVAKIIDVDDEMNKLGSFTKVSTDKRLKCQEIPDGAVGYTAELHGTFKCEIVFDSSSGAINNEVLNTSKF